MNAQRPLLSLVMVVRNEAHTLRTTFESVKGVVDRLTIVDTGSRDGTQEIVQAQLRRDSGEPLAGISGHIFRQPFTDYSTVRNFALDVDERQPFHGDADGPRPARFALSLSADETLHGGDQLRAFLSAYDGHESAFLVEIRSDMGATLFPRVLKTGSPWRYEGVVHERPVNRTECKDPTVVIPGVWIEHHASDPERRLRRLREFDVPALERAIADGTDEADCTRHVVLLAQTHEQLAMAATGVDPAAYFKHQSAALGLYLLAAHRSSHKLDTENYAILHARLIVRALGLSDDRDLLRDLTVLQTRDPARPDVALAIAHAAMRLDPTAGYDKALAAVEVAKAAGNKYVLADPSMEWKAHLTAVLCAWQAGDQEKARQHAADGRAAGGPAEAFAGVLG